MKFYMSRFDDADLRVLVKRADACTARLLRERPDLVEEMRSQLLTEEEAKEETNDD